MDTPGEELKNFKKNHERCSNSKQTDTGRLFHTSINDVLFYNNLAL